MSTLGPSGVYKLLRSMGISDTILANDPILRPYILADIKSGDSNVSKEEAMKEATGFSCSPIHTQVLSNFHQARRRLKTKVV